MIKLTVKETEDFVQRVHGYMMKLSEILENSPAMADWMDDKMSSWAVSDRTAPVPLIDLKDLRFLTEDITLIKGMLDDPMESSIHEINSGAFVDFCKDAAIDLLEKEEDNTDYVIFLLEMAQAITDGCDQIILRTKE